MSSKRKQSQKKSYRLRTQDSAKPNTLIHNLVHRNSNQQKRKRKRKTKTKTEATQSPDNDNEEELNLHISLSLDAQSPEYTQDSSQHMPKLTSNQIKIQQKIDKQFAEQEQEPNETIINQNENQKNENKPNIDETIMKLINNITILDGLYDNKAFLNEIIIRQLWYDKLFAEKLHGLLLGILCIAILEVPFVVLYYKLFEAIDILLLLELNKLKIESMQNKIKTFRNATLYCKNTQICDLSFVILCNIILGLLILKSYDKLFDKTLRESKEINAETRCRSLILVSYDKLLTDTLQALFSSASIILYIAIFRIIFMTSYDKLIAGKISCLLLLTSYDTLSIDTILRAKEIATVTINYNNNNTVDNINDTLMESIQNIIKTTRNNNISNSNSTILSIQYSKSYDNPIIKTLSDLLFNIFCIAIFYLLFPSTHIPTTSPRHTHEAPEHTHTPKPPSRHTHILKAPSIHTHIPKPSFFIPLIFCSPPFPTFFPFCMMVYVNLSEIHVYLC